MQEIRGVVFDLYGTLCDVHSVAQLCGQYFPERGTEISLMWRQKQLEYSWLRSLMGQYVSFPQATEDALVFVCNALNLKLREDTRIALCNEYLNIKPYREVRSALESLRSGAVPLAILSNGSAHSIQSVVGNAGIEHFFSHLISADEVSVSKPSPAAYELAEKRLKVVRSKLLFVSSNAWDASGARHFGFQVCWVNRSRNTFEQLGERPDHVISGLDELPNLLNFASADR
uniref:(S)-2-haloacid dehalogenase 2 n=1 Tax=Pseudomonas sp. (strain CBS-3) TaxID=72586 RepID=HAD2_PSEUC|nr:RecName: Full=(S)-2-haloacid dehalogenase 2; AltName: Full=2-haloalkanoic acid dehalogenase II; AltName: Full=DEHCII; AltName: Full=Halocarboxylic acid halidohydrolase II; AltName: Full=L-2-haloacid dehalogenase II [Pseudomonas sp. CBS3]AAA25833.1 2-haloalkanoic acid dehalogenase II [Pseudomonas sp.]